MRCLIEHGREAEELAGRRFINDHFLLIFIYGRDPDPSGDHDVRLSCRVAHFVDALTRGEFLEFHLSGQNSRLVIVQQSKERNIF